MLKLICQDKSLQNFENIYKKHYNIVHITFTLEHFPGKFSKTVEYYYRMLDSRVLEFLKYWNRTHFYPETLKNQDRVCN